MECDFFKGDIDQMNRIPGTQSRDSYGWAEDERPTPPPERPKNPKELLAQVKLKAGSNASVGQGRVRRLFNALFTLGKE